MSAIPEAPTTELGAPSRVTNLPGFPGAQVLDDREIARDLRWPRSVRVTYPAMFNDAQVDGLYRGMTWAIRAFDYWLEPNGASPSAVQRISSNYNLPVGRGTQMNRRRAQQRFRFDAHLEDALRAIGLGHYPFEQQYDVTQDGPAAINGGWVAHLRKLAPRPPYTIDEIRTAPDGGLQWIKVPALRPSEPALGGLIGTVNLPVDRVVFYAWDKEGANWRGRSMLRSLYRPWKLKDAVMRIGATNIERAGGVPYANAPDGANRQDRDDILAVLRQFRQGDEAAAVFPHGTELKFAAAAGGDQSVNYVKLQNEEMARAWLLMFMQLGQTQSGSRALAEPLIDYVRLGQMVVAEWFCGVFNEHVIEDDVELNEGPAEQYAPLLMCAPKGDPLDGVEGALEDAASAGALPDDSGVMAMVRRARAGAGGRSHRRPFRVSAASSSGAVDHVDWDAIDERWHTARTSLVESWADVQAETITQLVAAIEAAAGNLVTLGAVQANVRGADVLASAMLDIADYGVQTATDEARAQGVTLPDPWAGPGASGAIGDILLRPVSALRRFIEDRSAAIAAVLARAIGETASRQAVQRTVGSTPTADPSQQTVPSTGPAPTTPSGPPAPAEVAAEVGEHLRNLSSAFLEEQLGRALTEGFNGGRREAMRGAPDGSRFEASALLDTNTCTQCETDDGHVYGTLDEGEHQFPVGGNKDCLGGPRCRCTLVGVYGEAAPSVQ